MSSRAGYGGARSLAGYGRQALERSRGRGSYGIETVVPSPAVVMVKVPTEVFAV